MTMGKTRSDKLDCVPVLTTHGFVREDVERDNGSLSYIRKKDDICVVVAVDGHWSVWSLSEDEQIASGKGWVELLAYVDGNEEDGHGND